MKRLASSPPSSHRLAHIGRAFPGLLAPTLLAALACACVTVSVEEAPRLARLSEPVVDSACVVGPVFRDLRSAGFETATASTFESFNATGTSSSGSSASITGNQSGFQTTTNQIYERFDNRELESLFVRQLEDALVARRVLTAAHPDAWSTAVRFEATVGVRGDTGAVKIGWNVLNSVLMFSLLPTPFLGNSIVTVEVRAYAHDEFVRSYAASARTSWTMPGLWGLAHTHGEAQRRSLSEAGAVAITKVVREIADHPPGR